MACSSEGIQELFKKIESGTEEEVRIIINEVNNNFHTIVMDVYGVSLVMKLLELGSVPQKELILRLMKTCGPGYKGLAYHKYGYKIICKAIEICPLPVQLEILNSFKGNIIALSKRLNSRNVIETCLEVMGSNYIQFILDEISGHVFDLLRDMDGFLVIKKILLQLPNELSSVVLQEIVQFASKIVTDACGGKIIDVILSTGREKDAFQVIDALKGVFVFLSQNQSAASILSKCLSLAHSQQIDSILDEVVGVDDAGLIVMMKDKTAHIVLLDLIKACNRPQREFLLSKIDTYGPNMMCMPHGHNFFQAIREIERTGFRQH